MNAQHEVFVELVDAVGNTIGLGEKAEVHRKGLRHRAISCLLFSRDGKVLLQQRAAAKYHSPLLWSNACCTHPYPGEAPDLAAARRLQEEMGITTPLYDVTTFSYCADVGNDMIENEYVHVFTGVVAADASPDPAEVEAWCWLHLEEVALILRVAPEQLTPWFRIYLRHGLLELAAGVLAGGAR